MVLVTLADYLTIITPIHDEETPPRLKQLLLTMCHTVTHRADVHMPTRPHVRTHGLMLAVSSCAQDLIRPCKGRQTTCMVVSCIAS